MEQGVYPFAVLCGSHLTLFLYHLGQLLVNEGTNFTTALYCHRFWSNDVIGHT